MSNIIKFFGKPALPMLINEPVFYLNESKKYELSKAYLFINNHTYTLYQQGNPSPINFIRTKTELNGYFEMNNIDLLVKAIRGKPDEQYYIKSFFNNKLNFTLTNVYISKKNFISNKLTLIKFFAENIIYSD